MRQRRWLLILLVCLLPRASLAADVVRGEHVQVIYAAEAQRDYALRVQRTAERALLTLRKAYGYTPKRVTLRLNDQTDVFNAVAAPLPRLNVAVRELFPATLNAGYGSSDPLYFLLLHELTHIFQFSNPQGRQGGLSVGLVGENLAALPPNWLIEGLAVWDESHFSAGGRLHAAATEGFLSALAGSPHWPTFADLNRGAYDAWPGPQADYLLGAAFTDDLISRYGFASIRRVLAARNRAGLLESFSETWARVNGSDLAQDYAAFSEARRQRGRQYQRRQQTSTRPRSEAKLRPLDSSGLYTRAPVLSPSLRKFAWINSENNLVVATLGNSGELKDRRVLKREKTPGALAWLDERTLIYSRLVAGVGHSYYDVFTLDTRSAAETRQTYGARALRVEPLQGGCFLFERDAVTGSSLHRKCPQQAPSLVYRTARGTHIIGLATSLQGQLALSLWRRGKMRLVVLKRAEKSARYTPYKALPWSRAQPLRPVWQGEESVYFSSDGGGGGGGGSVQGGRFNLYRFKVASGRLARLKASVAGGIFDAAPTKDGGLILLTLHGNGFHLSYAPRTSWQVASLQKGAARRARRGQSQPPKLRVAPLKVQRYTPWSSLRPYGWLPSALAGSVYPLAVQAEASLLAQDDTLAHSWETTLGWSSQRSELLGLYGFVQYDYHAGLPLYDVPPPVAFGVRLGLWPQGVHASLRQHLVYGAKGYFKLTLPQDALTYRAALELGLLHVGGEALPLALDGALTVSANTLKFDDFGYPVAGWHLAAHGVVSATGKRPVVGAWLAGSIDAPAPFGLTGPMELSLLGGYKPSYPMPTRPLAGWGAAIGVGVQQSWPLAVIYKDGMFALERLTLKPKAYLWADRALYAGGELQVGLDVRLSYRAPVALLGTLGYSGSFWSRLGLQVPLER